MSTVSVPGFEEYKKALSTLDITSNQRQMLKAHYDCPNRSITYRALAAAAGFKDYRIANLQYGKLGAALGEALGFQFQKFGDSDVDFMTSAIAMPTDRHYQAGDEFEIVMHHEVAKALDDLHWFKS